MLLKRLPEGALGCGISEGLLDLTLDPLRGFAVHPLRLATVLVENALVLTPNEVDLDLGILAVEHPRADLDRPPDRPRRLFAGLRTLPDDPRGALVRDRETLDDEPVLENADDAVGRG